MAAGSRSAIGPKPPEPGVTMSMTEPAGAPNAPLLGRCTRRAVRRRELHHGGRSGLASEQAERRRGHPLHAQCSGRIGALQQAPAPYCAAAAAIPPGAARIRIDLVALDAHRKRRLHDFDRRVHRIGDAAGDAVDAILVRPRTESALHGLIGHVVPAAAGIDAAQRQDGRGALAAGHHLLRHEARERTHHHVGHTMRYLVVRIDDRSRKLGIHEDPMRRRGIRHGQAVAPRPGFRPRAASAVRRGGRASLTSPRSLA